MDSGLWFTQRERIGDIIVNEEVNALSFIMDYPFVHVHRRLYEIVKGGDLDLATGNILRESPRTVPDPNPLFHSQ